jgi:hypothetical protein
MCSLGGRVFAVRSLGSAVSLGKVEPNGFALVMEPLKGGTQGALGQPEKIRKQAMDEQHPAVGGEECVPVVNLD